MSDESKRRARLRWVTLGEAVAIAAVVVSGLGLYTSWQDKQESRAEKAAETHRAAPFALKASGGGETLALTSVASDQVVQGQTLRFPPAFALAPVTTTSDARIEADWFAPALKKDRDARKLPDETPGDARLPVMIETAYLADGQPAKARAFYDIGYVREAHFLRGSSVRLRGLSLIGKAPADDGAADRRLAALWDARAGTGK